MDFTTKKFYKSLTASTFTLTVQYIMMLSDNLIVGNLVGQEAVSAMSLISPIATFLTFICLLNTLGSTICRARELGNFNKKRADQFFSQGIIVSIASGIILFVILLLGANAYISFFNVSTVVAMYVKEYLKFYVYIVLISSINMYLSNIILADGDVFICNVSFVAQIIGNILFSLLLTMKMGVTGAALGSLITMVLNIIILAAHFLKKDNQLKFKWHFSMNDLYDVCHMSIADTACRILWAIQFMVFNKFTITVYGDQYLPIVSVITNIIQFSNLFHGVGIALRSFVRIYLAEKNVKGMKLLMKAADKATILESLITTVLLLIFAGQISRFFGISDPHIIAVSKVCVGILSISLIFHAVEFTYGAYYLMIEKFALSWGITLLEQLAAPILALILGYVFKAQGIPALCAGLSIGALITLFIFIIYIYKKYGKEKYHIMLDSDGENNFYLNSFELNTNNLMSAIDLMETFLKEKNISDIVINRVRLIAEETGMSILEKNPNKKTLVELVVNTNNGLRLLVRDDGIIFNLTDPNNELKSFRDFVYSSLMEYHNERYYIANAGYNRNAFDFQM